MRMSYGCSIVLVLFAANAGSASIAWGIQPLQTSVCEIIAKPYLFEGRVVTIRGAVYAGMDLTNVSDVSCPGAMIQLTVNEARSGHKDIQAFEKGIRAHGMRATVTIVGKFQAKAQVYPFAMPAIDLYSVRRIIYKTKHSSKS